MTTRRTRPLHFLLLSIVALAAAPTLADPGSAPETDKDIPRIESTEVVVVTAPRIEVPLMEIPGAATVVDQQDLEKTRSKTIAADDALKFVPGVKVDNQADGERVHLSIRGEGILTERGVRRIAVLLDGIPLNDPMGLVPDLFDVDWETVRRVEVLRGPMSSLYGAGAAGGVINIVTRDGGPRNPEGDASINVGSYGFRKLFAETDGTAGALSYRLSASRMFDDGYRVHTASDATNVYGKLSWTRGPSSHLTAIVAQTEYFNGNAEGLNIDQVFQDPRQANPDGVASNEYQYTRRVTTGLTGDYTPGSHNTFSFAIYSRLTTWRESVPSTVIYRTYSNPGALLQYTLHTGGSEGIKNDFSVGVDLAWQSVDEQKVVNPLLATAHPDVYPEIVAQLPTDTAYHQSSRGVFLLDRLELGHGWGLVGSLRWDGFNTDFDDRLAMTPVSLPSYDKTTGRIGATWNPWKSRGFYANWGQGFTPPTTEELINNPVAFGGYNQSLVAETSSGEEVGARGSLGKQGSYDVAVFHMSTDNDFGRYRVAGRDLETFYYNAGSSRRYGLETSVGWEPFEGFSTQLAYTYSDFKYSDVKFYTQAVDPEDPGTQVPLSLRDAWLPNIPRHQAYLDLEYRGVPRWTFGASLEALSRAYVDPTNTSWSWGYGLVHLRAAYRWQARSAGGDVSLVVRNAGNRKYIAFTEPDPDGNSYHTAATREIFLSARIRLGERKRA
ncbi:MAG: TonB-dependent receptor [Acidobacteriia bacterium]|nr:TonB-dependent receptor [Terriglobia bacterium]